MLLKTIFTNLLCFLKKKPAQRRKIKARGRKARKNRRKNKAKSTKRKRKMIQGKKTKKINKNRRKFNKTSKNKNRRKTITVKKQPQKLSHDEQAMADISLYKHPVHGWRTFWQPQDQDPGEDPMITAQVTANLHLDQNPWEPVEPSEKDIGVSMSIEPYTYYDGTPVQQQHIQASGSAPEIITAVPDPSAIAPEPNNQWGYDIPENVVAQQALSAYPAVPQYQDQSHQQRDSRAYSNQLEGNNIENNNDKAAGYYYYYYPVSAHDLTTTPVPKAQQELYRPNNIQVKLFCTVPIMFIFT